MITTTFMDAALALAEKRFSVFPCAPKEKLPLGGHGFLEATSEAATITRWWTGTPDANIGLACGMSGLVVVDVDPRHGGNETQVRLEKELGALPKTVEALTGGPDGGRHLYFKAPKDCKLRGSLGDGLDLKFNGYVLAPRSVHPTGGVYTWKNSPFDCEIAELPAPWSERMTRREAAPPVTVKARTQDRATTGGAYGRRAVEEEIAAVRNAPEGDRNKRLFKASLSLGQLHAGGEIGDVRDELFQAAIEAGLSEHETQSTIRSGWNKGQAEPRKAKPTGRKAASAPAAEQPEMVAPESARHRYFSTESGNAERFADLFRGEVIFVAEWGKWYTWTGTYWAHDVGGVAVLEKTKAVVRAILIEAAGLSSQDEHRAEELTKWALSSQRLNSRRATLELAKAERAIAVSIDEFDRDPFLLNCQNGTLDLRTGKLRPHRREDKITRILPWPFDPGAKCPRLEMFFTEVLDGPETIAFVQRAIGYTLTADVAEHVVFFLHGPGANGKTVILDALLTLLDDYGVQAPVSMLLAKQGEVHPTELTVMFGRRAVVCSETPAGRGWAEETVKHVSGGDRISARRMREDFWQFSPTHKLWVSGNHKPIVRGTDEGIWRRLRLIPFEKVIPEADRDPKLSDKLREEMPGFLAWAVRGCLAWQAHGLVVSAKVKAATSSYREESDRLRPFVIECCIENPKITTPRADLFRAYLVWVETQGERPMSDRAFADSLRGRGIRECWTQANGKRCRGWEGIGLLCNSSNSKPHDFGYDGIACAQKETTEKTGGNVLHLLPGDSEPAALETPDTDEEGAF